MSSLSVRDLFSSRYVTWPLIYIIGLACLVGVSMVASAMGLSYVNAVFAAYAGVWGALPVVVLMAYIGRR